MKHMKIISRTLVVLFVASAITACGFHLRGNTPLPAEISNIYIEAKNGPFKEKMEEVLSYGGATIATVQEAASSTLIVQKSIVEKTVGTIDERGKANSYELTYKVNYKLVDREGVSLRTASLYENRRFDFDPDTVLETESEEENLIVDMEESIALRVVRQLATIKTGSSAN